MLRRKVRCNMRGRVEVAQTALHKRCGVSLS
jgi:hypothetical protein